MWFNIVPIFLEGGGKTNSLSLNPQSSITSSAGIVIKRDSLVKSFCTEIIGKYDRKQSYIKTL